MKRAREDCIHDLFEKQARRKPLATALLLGSKAVTYGEVNRRSNQVAHYLRGLGVGPEVLVAVCQERSVEMIIAVLGVLKAGGAYVPLDPGYPRERLAMILEDTKAPVFLTSEKLLDRFADPGGVEGTRVVALDRDREAIDLEAEDEPESGVSSANLAYVLYTSGSTGRPKGVLVEHRGLMNLAEAVHKIFGRGPRDRILQFFSLCFDASSFEFLMAWRAGASLCLVPSDRLLVGSNLAETLRDEAVTTASMPPSVLAGLPDGDYPALETIIVGGEACPSGLPERWSAGRRVFNLYGPTEATVCVSVGECSGDGKKPPIGRPIPGARVYLLDDLCRPVGAGQPGELCVGGLGVSRGYFGRPGLTAEAFVPDPFDAEPGARMYRTGDRARLLEDGQLEFLGRADHQVKIRGFRVELGEIEATLWKHPDVETVVVEARQDGGGPKRLVAYVKPPAGRTPSLTALRAFLKERLPDHMTPSAFVIMEDMPRLPSGKIDRGALPAPEAVRPDLDVPFAAPRTATEELLAGVWAEVLGLDRVGINDDFFALGGDSLLATQMVSRLWEASRLEMPLQAVFGSPTVADLAAVVEAVAGEVRPRSGTGFPPIRRLPRDGTPWPLSYSQERVWFLQQLEPGHLSYNAQATITFQGELNVAVLERALSEVVRRHEIFRTSFPVMNGHPVQVLHEPWIVTLPLVDLGSLPVEARQTRLKRLVDEAIRRPFDLDRLPLVRWSLVRLGPEEHILTHSEHHLVHDGWSFGVLLRETKALYEAFLVGEPSPLPELDIQFGDYAVWQREWADSDIVQPQLDYWRRQLAGSRPILELPTDRPRPPVQSFRGSAARVELPTRLSKILALFARKEGVTLYVTLLAAFVALLYRYTRQEDFCLGAGLANRRWREIENVIGMVINTVALRFRPSGRLTFRELLGQIRQVTLEAQEHQDVPFDRVVDILRPERSLSHLPIYQVVFAFHDSPMPEFELGGATMRVTEGLNIGWAKFDLSVVGIPRCERQSAVARAAGVDHVSLIWEYNTDLFEVSTITRLAGHYERLLEAFASDPSQTLESADLLTEAEKAALLSTEDAAEGRYPSEATVSELVGEQARRTPDAEAVSFGERSLTYRELDLRAERLARRLRALGVGPETVVAVRAERSLHLVPGLLGILKAGAAYMPVDPAYPEDRVEFMLREARVPVVLVEGRSPAAASEPPSGPVVAAAPRSPIEIIDLAAFFDGPEDPKGVPAGTRSESTENEASASGRLATVRASAGNLAYVIYTSGSTGWPKGVMVEHRSLLNLIFWHRQAFGITAADRASQVAGLGFDAAVWEIWPYLVTGASVHLVEKGETRVSPEAIRDWLVAKAVTVAFLPTPLAEAVLKLDWPPGVACRYLLTGGDRLHVRPPATLPFDLINNYGPTENTVVTTSGLVQAREGREVTPHIGRPVANNRVYLLDSGGRPVPPGVPGELCVAGESLSRGYLGRPDLTAEAFRPNPFAREPGARLYRSGDLVRRLADGNLDFLGRLDHQVKIRGFRVELREIEAVLGRHPSVQETVVVAADGPPKGSKRLVGYVVPAPGHKAGAKDLKAFLGARLPEYMIPSVFVDLASLPIDANGKVDRRALPPPAQAPEETEGDASDAPRTPLEEQLVAIWLEILGLDRVGRADDFFALGGHSLMATQVLSRIRTSLGLELPLSSLFRTPTIAGLAETVQELLLGQKAEAGDRP